MNANTSLNGEPVLALDHVSKRFGTVVALDDVSFQIRRGEAVGIIGPSGGGKTTLLRCVDLLLPIDSGSIHYSLKRRFQADATGVEVTLDSGANPVSAVDVRRSIGFVFQRVHLWPERTVLSNLTLAAEVVNSESHASARERAIRISERFGILDKLGNRVWQLSGGQQQRAALVRALMMDPKLLLLDEITSALDPVLTASVMDMIRDLREQGMTMLLVTHHIEFAARVCDRLLFLDRGKILQVGEPEELLQRPGTTAVRDFLNVLRRVR